MPCSRCTAPATLHRFIAKQSTRVVAPSLHVPLARGNRNSFDGAIPNAKKCAFSEGSLLKAALRYAGMLNVCRTN